MQDYLKLRDEVEVAYSKLRISSLQRENSVLLAKMHQPNFWSDNSKAQEISKKQSNLQKRIDFWNKLKSDSNDLIDLAELNDESLELEIKKQYQLLNKQYLNVKRELQFRGPYDQSNVILSIFAGAGGTDAQDWASMLLRMYRRWAEKEGLKIATLDISAGDEAGLKSVTIDISEGDFLYGKLQGENGVHRLVRLSPFNSDNLRQTSFARVEVIPKIESPELINLEDKDLKIDVYRSGGKGGQSVNTTDSAVRITHIPTGIVVAIQNERSQLQNRETALTILRSKLAQMQLDQHKDKISELKGSNKSNEWGSQIRNYVLHPYSMVKDTRTKHETTEVQRVLDGGINSFIEAYLDSLL